MVRYNCPPFYCCVILLVICATLDFSNGIPIDQEPLQKYDNGGLIPNNDNFPLGDGDNAQNEKDGGLGTLEAANVLKKEDSQEENKETVSEHPTLDEGKIPQLENKQVNSENEQGDKEDSIGSLPFDNIQLEKRPGEGSEASNNQPADVQEENKIQTLNSNSQGKQALPVSQGSIEQPLESVPPLGIQPAKNNPQSSLPSLGNNIGALPIQNVPLSLGNRLENKNNLLGSNNGQGDVGLPPQNMLAETEKNQRPTPIIPQQNSVNANRLPENRNYLQNSENINRPANSNLSPNFGSPAREPIEGKGEDPARGYQTGSTGQNIGTEGQAVQGSTNSVGSVLNKLGLGDIYNENKAASFNNAGSMNNPPEGQTQESDFMRQRQGLAGEGLSGQGQGQAGQGQSLFGQGQSGQVQNSFGQDQLGRGQGLAQQGQSPIDKGQGVTGHGQSPFGPRQGLAGQEQTPFQQGEGLAGQGQIPIGQGQVVTGQGQSNFGPGQGLAGQSQIPIGQGQGVLGQGQSPLGQAQGLVGQGQKPFELGQGQDLAGQGNNEDEQNEANTGVSPAGSKLGFLENWKFQDFSQKGSSSSSTMNSAITTSTLPVEQEDDDVPKEFVVDEDMNETSEEEDDDDNDPVLDKQYTEDGYLDAPADNVDNVGQPLDKTYEDTNRNGNNYDESVDVSQNNQRIMDDNNEQAVYNNVNQLGEEKDPDEDYHLNKDDGDHGVEEDDDDDEFSYDEKINEVDEDYTGSTTTPSYDETDDWYDDDDDEEEEETDFFGNEDTEEEEEDSDDSEDTLVDEEALFKQKHPKPSYTGEDNPLYYNKLNPNLKEGLVEYKMIQNRNSINAPSSMVLFYTWIILVILITVVTFSAFRYRCKGLFANGSRTYRNGNHGNYKNGEENKKLLENVYT